MPHPAPSAKVNLMVRIDPRLQKSVARVAAKLGQPLTVFVARALQDAVAKHDEAKAA